MKHWDGRDHADASPAQLSPRDRQRLRAMFAEPPQPKRGEHRIGAVIGLSLSVALLVGLAWVLAPGDPISPKILR